MDFKEKIYKLLLAQPSLTRAVIFDTYDKCTETQEINSEQDELTQCINHVTRHDECQKIVIEKLNTLLT